MLHLVRLYLTLADFLLPTTTFVKARIFLWIFNSWLKFYLIFFIILGSSVIESGFCGPANDVFGVLVLGLPAQMPRQQMAALEPDDRQEGEGEMEAVGAEF